MPRSPSKPPKTSDRLLKTFLFTRIVSQFYLTYVSEGHPRSRMSKDWAKLPDVPQAVSAPAVRPLALSCGKSEHSSAAHTPSTPPGAQQGDDPPRSDAFYIYPHLAAPHTRFHA